MPRPTAQFVLGRAAAGKSRLLADRAAARLRESPTGPAVIFVVPRQATLGYERHLTLEHDLPGTLRLRVFSFETLRDALADELGPASSIEVDRSGRLMLLGHLLRRHADDLRYFKAAARHAGTVAQIDATLRELHAAGLAPDDLARHLADADADRAADLALLQAKYEAALGDRLDPLLRDEALLQRVHASRLVADASLYVDAHTRLPARDRQLLAAVAAAARETTVAVQVDPAAPDRSVPDSNDLFAENATMHRQAQAALGERGVKVLAPVTLDSARPARGGGQSDRPLKRADRSEVESPAPAIALIERQWSQPRPAVGHGLDRTGVRLAAVPDPRAEAHFAAAQVKDWLRGGLRPREVIVLARDLDAYRPMLEDALADAGVPTFADRRRPARHHPAFRCLRSLLRVAALGWRHGDVMDLVRCGTWGGDAEAAFALENYVLEHRVRGRTNWTAAKPWTTRRGEDDDDANAIDESAEGADAARRLLVDAVEPLAKVLNGLDRPAREHAAAAWEALERLGAADVFASCEPGGEDAEAWAALCDLLDQAAELFGDEAMPGGEFARLAEFAVDQLDFPVLPPTLDAVTIGEPSRLVLPPGVAKACVVVGLADGVFPAAAEAQLVLGDDDRRRLQAAGVDLEPASDERQAAERLLAYHAFTRASQHLTLVRPLADASGLEVAASPFFERVRRLLDAEEERPAEVDRIAGPRPALAAAMRWARAGADPDAPEAAVYGHLAADPREYAATWAALSYANRCELGRDAVRRLFGGGDLDTSVGRLESFVRCPFQHFARHTLGLRRRDEQRVTPRDLGLVYHAVLDRLVRDGGTATAFDDRERVVRRLPVLTDEAAAGVRGGILGQDGRGRYLARRATRDLAEVAANAAATLDLGEFRPAWTELDFGGREQSSLPPLELDLGGGKVARVHGRIDRVDATADRRAAVVLDYKATRGPAPAVSERDAYYGLSVQLLVYLIVLQEHGGRLTENGVRPQPVAGFYVRLIRPLERADDPAAEPGPGDPLFDLRTKPRGIIDYSFLPLLDAGFANADPSAERHLRHESAGYHARTKADGGPYAACDVAETESIDALMARVRGLMTEAASGILSGEVAPRPYRLGRRTPCGRCECRPVCRFETPPGRYRHLDGFEAWKGAATDE